MNLRAVHAILIFLSAILAVLFGVWCLNQYGRGEGAGTLFAGVVSFAMSAGLVVYDSWFLRINTANQKKQNVSTLSQKK